MSLPFDGAISEFFKSDAAAQIREAIKKAGKKDIIDDYPYATELDKETYEETLHALQVELVKLQHWVKETGTRVAIVFEGRDAAGKGGTIKRIHENLNPRGCRVVALSKPTETEASQWYFQRYINELPAGGEIVLFDRSWYNRGVVEKVFDFCTTQQREHFFRQVLPFEEMLVDEGIHLIKVWLNVGRAEQLRRFLDREQDPLKQWKLSWIDVEGLKRWDAYSEAIQETLLRSHAKVSPWNVVRSDDKRRARIEVLRLILSGLDYTNKDADVISTPDPQIVGDPGIWHV
ncbi:polyphosphate kinase 2 [Donghicola sp. C2-DW-16]|uniref:ADP/GDP-polyphosphate phosphotransferase n=1 Tax=Donghicola mangrovi TaxID=2729614 RepID=A0ABX2PEM1_9RHOB|nr:polyphosphate kinase 2 [Donghicola mangrovi]NVO27828.1 polyphosphate kinase 2 [Donghicola mangrovi]